VRNNITYKVVASALGLVVLALLGWTLRNATAANGRQDAQIATHSGRITAMEVDIRYIRERVDRIADKLEVN